MKALDVGLHSGIPDEFYHSDCCPAPSLSASIGKLLVERSPRHAWFAHPKLNPDFSPDQRDPSRAMDKGSAAHTMMLGIGRRVCVIDADAYTTKAAREARDAARANGEIPLLAADFDEVMAMVESGKAQIATDPDIAGCFENGTPELTMVWREGDIWCRSRIDYLPNAAREGGHVRVFDLKTVSGSARPDEFVQPFYNFSYDLQAAFYERGLRTLIPTIRSVEFVFIVLEQEPPYGLTAVSLGGEALAMAYQKSDLAVQLWGECMRRNEWPGYEGGVHRIDPPFWRAQAHELRRLAMLDRIAKWQRPHVDPATGEIKGEAA